MIDLWPPALYDHAPDVHVYAQLADDPAAECRRVGAVVPPGVTVHGCQVWVGPLCKVILPKRSPYREAVWHHEIAHCNGWRHTAP